MHDRPLTVVRRGLGRIYPSDVESQIQQLAARIDDMMASSVDLATFADTDLSGQISELNASLLNDVVLPSDELSDDEARNRLAAVDAEASRLEGIFATNGVQIGTGAGQLTADVLSAKQAEGLSAQMDKAFNVYAGIADRMSLAQPMILSALALPGTGANVSAMLSSLQTRLAKITPRLATMHSYTEQLDDAISGSPSVKFDRSKAADMQRFAADILQADEALKRLEAIVLRKQVEPTPSARGAAKPGIPTTIVAVAGLVLVGLAFWAISSDGGKKK